MPGYPYFSVTKTFGHDLGLSCCFRQWRAKHSHCRFLHGYAIAVAIEIRATRLDKRNWTFDFGDFTEVREFLKQTFDHKLIVAEDDPQKDEICALAGLDAADCLVLPAVGCEQFAHYVHTFVNKIVKEATNGRAILYSVTIMEHGANSATYTTPA